MYAKDLSELKYEFLIKKHEDAGTKHLNDSNEFFDCSNTIDVFMEILMTAIHKDKEKY